MRVFLSYSRRDTPIADRMVLDLEARGLDVEIDRRDLPYGEEWQVELGKFIHTSDTIVWLASEASVGSSWVKWELGEAQRLNKRLLPVRVGPLLPEDLPEALGRIHILPAEGVYDPAVHLDMLVAAIETDRGWMEMHTRLGDRAAEWIARNRSADRLLRGRALRDAEDWRDSRPERAPAPGTDTLDLLLQSRRAATRGLRVLVALAAAGFVAMTGLAGYAWQQSQIAWEKTAIAEQQTELAEQQTEIAKQQTEIAEERERQANEQRVVAQGNEYRALANLSLSALSGTRYTEAQLLSLAAWPRRTESEVVRLERPMDTIALASVGHPLLEVDLTFGRNSQILPSPDGKRVLVISSEQERPSDISYGKIRLADARTGATIDSDVTELVDFGWPRFSPDGRSFVTWARNGRVDLWNTETGDHLAAVTAFGRGVEWARFNPAGTTILARGDAGEVRLWDAASGKVTSTWLARNAFYLSNGLLYLALEGGDEIWSADLSRMIVKLPGTAGTLDVETPDASRVATLMAGEYVSLWSTVDGTRLCPRLRTPDVHDMAFSSDGTTFAWWTTSARAYIFDITTCSYYREATAVSHSHIYGPPLISADSRHVLTLASNGLTYSSLAGDEVWHVSKDISERVVFDTDRARVAAWNDRSLDVIDIETGRSVVQLARPNISGASFSTDGDRLLVVQGSSATLFDIQSGMQLGPAMHHAQAIEFARFEDTDRIIETSSADGTLRRWDVDSFMPVQTVLPSGERQGSALSADQDVLLIWDDDGGGVARAWNLETSEPFGPQIQVGGPQYLVNAALSEDATKVVVWSPGALRVFDLASGKPVGPWVEHGDDIRSARFSRDGSKVLSVSGDVRLWDAATGEMALAPLADADGVKAWEAWFNEDETRILATSPGGRSWHWDARTGSLIGQPMHNTGPVWNAFYYGDESRIITHSHSEPIPGLPDNQVMIWNAETGELIALLPHDAEVLRAALGPKAGQMSTWTDDGKVHVWDIERATEAFPPLSHDIERGSSLGGDVTGDFAFDPAGTMILSWVWSETDTIRLWDAQSGKQLGRTMRHPGIEGARFVGDGSRFVSWSVSSVRVWDVAAGRPIGLELPGLGEIIDVKVEGDEIRITSAVPERGLVISRARIPEGSFFRIACDSLVATDLSMLSERLGIKIDEPICTPEQLAVPIDWTTIERLPGS